MTLVSLAGQQFDRSTVDLSAIALQDSSPRCYVYEVWDSRRRLAYVGVADNFSRRWRQHRRNSWWLGEIEVTRIDVSGYLSRHEARQVEAAAINETSPVYNTEKESRMYAEYLRLWTDPQRMSDDYDCVPVDRFIYRRVPA